MASRLSGIENLIGEGVSVHQSFSMAVHQLLPDDGSELDENHIQKFEKIKIVHYIITGGRKTSAVTWGSVVWMSCV